MKSPSNVLIWTSYSKGVSLEKFIDSIPSGLKFFGNAIGTLQLQKACERIANAGAMSIVLMEYENGKGFIEVEKPSLKIERLVYERP